MKKFSGRLVTVRYVRGGTPTPTYSRRELIPLIDLFGDGYGREIHRVSRKPNIGKTPYKSKTPLSHWDHLRKTPACPDS